MPKKKNKNKKGGGNVPPTSEEKADPQPEPEALPDPQPEPEAVPGTSEPAAEVDAHPVPEPEEDTDVSGAPEPASEVASSAPPAPPAVPDNSRPVPFIQQVDGKFVLCDEGAAVLRNIPGPVAVIAVAGLYRTGKSFFLNQLMGRHGEQGKTGFGVGMTTKACTRGIHLWVAENVPIANGGTLVLLDTEGMASVDQDETYDALIFSLGLLLSSYFVLNSMGVIDESAIDRLYLVSELTKHICVSMKPGGAAAAAAGAGEAGGNGEAQAPPAEEGAASSPPPDGPPPAAATQEEVELELASHFPPIMWLLRDFVLDVVDDGTLEAASASQVGDSFYYYNSA
jgi:hypothetical protein